VILDGVLFTENTRYQQKAILYEKTSTITTADIPNSFAGMWSYQRCWRYFSDTESAAD
jgi:hypothetical protein